MNTDTVLSDVEALIRNLELPYLKKIQRQLDIEVKKREDSSITDAIVEIHKIAAKVGMKEEDLLQIKNRIKTASTAPVKYRHPHQPELHWSGRGRTPGWVKAWLDNGKRMKDLEVD